MLRSLRVLLTKEFLQIRRDPVILRMLLVVPMVQLVVLSNAATFEVASSALWVVNQDGTPAANALVDRFTATQRFAVAGVSATDALADEALRDGSANAVLVIPAGFARDLTRDRATTVQLVLNAENGSQAGVIQSYAGEIIRRYSEELALASRPPRSAGSSLARAPVPGRPMVEIRARGRYNTALDYKRYMVPGILVQLITIVGTLMTALNIVREKEAGTIDQLNVTPIRPAVFIAAKLLPLWIIGLVEFTMGLTIAALVFHVPMSGSLPTLYAGAMLFLLAALGIGLWVSTISETQQQAMFVTFMLMMIYILMSGLFTPVRAMPQWVRVVAQANPLMHFIVMTRAILLKGAGLADVWHQLVALALLGATILAVAVGRYQKRTA